MATVTHFEPCASGPVAFVWVFAGGCLFSLLGCFCRQLHTLSPLPVSLSPSLAAGGSSLLVCFWRQLHTLSPIPTALSHSLGIRWRLVGLASCVVFVDLLGCFLSTVAHLEPCVIFLGSVCIHFGIIFEFGIISGSCGDHFGIRLGSFLDHLIIFWDYFGPTSYRFPIFPDFSLLYLSSFRDHLEITLGSVWGHFVIIVCTWHSPGIILEFLWGHLLSFWDHFGFGVISWSSGGHFGIIFGSF